MRPTSEAESGEGKGMTLPKPWWLRSAWVVLHELAHDGAKMTLAEGDNVPQALVPDRGR
jgi:hypothetical protein